MTKSNAQQDKRYNAAKDEANIYANKTYDTYDSWVDDFNKYLGTRNNRTYDGDMYDIHKSGGGWDVRSKTLGKNMVNQYEKYIKNLLEKQYNTKFGAEGWQNSYLPTNEASLYVDNYLNNEYNSALEQLERAFKRGTLNDDQYNNAISKLDMQRNAANSTYGQLDEQLMDTYKTGYQEFANKYVDDIANYTLHNYDTLNMNTINNDLLNQQADYLNDMSSTLDQNLLAMSQDNPLFDINSIIGNAKVASGVYNNKSDNLLQAISDEEAKKEQQKIGLGNQGLF